MATRSVEELFRHRTIVKAISRIKSPVTPVSDFYGVAGAKGRTYVPTREFAADIYNNTRLLSKIRPPKTAPTKRRRHPVGTMTAHMIRIHEEVDIFDDDIAKYRPVGGQVGELDNSGQAWVGREVKRSIQRHANTIEFMFVRMLMGGFGVKKNDEEYNVVEKSASGYTFNVDYPIPAGNLTDIGGIFADPWSTASTNVVKQFLDLNAYGIRISGYTPQIVWMNTLTYNYLITNTTIRAVQGTYVRIFSMQDGRELSTIGEGKRQSGWLVKFTAIPQITFIVTDEVLNIDQEVDSTTAGNSTKLIPDGKVLITPAPAKGEWYDMVETDEPVRELPSSPNSQMRKGFYSWQCPFEKPPGRSLTILDNVLPVLYNPNVVFYADVYTP